MSSIMPLTSAPSQLSLSRSSSLMSEGSNPYLGEPLPLLALSDDSLFKSIDVFDYELSMTDIHLEEPEPLPLSLIRPCAMNMSKQASTTSLPSSLNSSYPDSAFVKSFSTSSQAIKSKDEKTQSVIPKVILNDTCGPLFQKTNSFPSRDIQSSKSKSIESVKCNASVLENTVEVTTSPQQASEMKNPIKTKVTSSSVSPLSKYNTKELITGAVKTESKEEKPIKIQSMVSESKNSSATKLCLGMLHGKQVESKVDSGLKSKPKSIPSISRLSVASDTLVSNRMSLTTLKTQRISSSHIAFGSRYDLNAHKSSSQLNMKGKKDISKKASRSIPELMVQPDWLEYPFTYSNKYASVPSKVKAYIEGKSTTSLGSSSYSTSIFTSQSQSLEKSFSSVGTKSGNKTGKADDSECGLSQKSIAESALYQESSLLQPSTQIQQRHPRDTMPPKLYSEPKKQLLEHQANVMEMQRFYSFKPLTIALMKKTAEIELSKYSQPTISSKPSHSPNEETKTYTVKPVKFFPLFPRLTGASTSLKHSSPNHATTTDITTKIQNQIHSKMGSTQTSQKRTRANLAVTSIQHQSNVSKPLKLKVVSLLLLFLTPLLLAFFL